MIKGLWARITGADKKKQYPDQQAVSLGRVGDYTVIFPYGMHCDLPDNALLKEVAPGVAIPVTVSRPEDSTRGEPTFFHPVTNTRLILRDNGDLDIFSASVNITATTAANITAPDTTINGNLTVTGETALGEVVTSNGVNISDTHTHAGSSTAPDGPVSNTGGPI